MKKSILLLILVSVCTLASSQKMVLFEKFTNAYCGVCPDASLQIKNIVEKNPNTIWINHHKPVTFTDNLLTNEQSIALWNDLNIAGVPTGMIDRKPHNNSISISRSLWQEKVEEQSLETSTFDIAIEDVSYDINTRDLQFDVVATPNGEVTPGSYRITAYILEDSVFYRQHSYFNEEVGHPLEGLGDIMWGHPHINVVRSILDSHMGTADIVPDDPITGTAYTNTYNYTVPTDHLTHNMKIVAMVSLHDEVNNYPGEVQNATRVILKELDIAVSSTDDFVAPSFTLSPNPTTDYLEITFKETPDRLMIVDMSGQVVADFKIQELNTRIDLHSYATGSYYLLVRTDTLWNGRQFMVTK